MRKTKTRSADLPSDEECWKAQVASLERGAEYLTEERDFARMCADKLGKKADVESKGRKNAQSINDKKIAALEAENAALKAEIERLKARLVGR